MAAGHIGEARELLAGWEISEDTGGYGHVPIVYAYLGDIDGTNRVLESMIADGVAMGEIQELLRFMPGHPMGKTRYNELRAAIGLPGLDED